MEISMQPQTLQKLVSVFGMNRVNLLPLCHTHTVYLPSSTRFASGNGGNAQPTAVLIEAKLRPTGCVYRASIVSTRCRDLGQVGADASLQNRELRRARPRLG